MTFNLGGTMFSLHKLIDISVIIVLFFIISFAIKHLSILLFIPFILCMYKMIYSTRYCNPAISNIVSPIDGAVKNTSSNIIEVSQPYLGIYNIYAPYDCSVNVQVEKIREMAKVHMNAPYLIYYSKYTFTFHNSSNPQNYTKFTVYAFSVLRQPIYDIVSNATKGSVIAKIAVGSWCNNVSIETNNVTVVKGMTLIGGETSISHT